MSIALRMAFEEFNQFYSEFWKDRWESLLHAIREPGTQVARGNRFTPSSSVLESEAVDPSSRCDVEGVLKFYIMDPASLLAAKSLQVQSGDKVLDLCAAPGGKTLILAEDLFLQEQGDLHGGELTANEYSKDRRERLKQVVQQYIPRRYRDQFWITGKDGLKFGKRPSKFYDRILADVPCSGERYQVEKMDSLSDWHVSRSESLSRRQYGLLTAAFESLAEGGRLVYSTCSLSPLENEEVLRKFLKKRAGRVRICNGDAQVQQALNGAMQALPSGLQQKLSIESWEFGYQLLPDRGGAGPLRWSILEKN